MNEIPRPNIPPSQDRLGGSALGVVMICVAVVFVVALLVLR